MRRRDFLALATWLVAAPPRASAQQGRLPRIAYLSIPQPTDWVEGFISGLADAGYTPGRNLSLEFFTAPTAADLPRFTAEAIAFQPDVVFAQGSPAALEAKRVTAAIPIVFYSAGDPVALGLIPSLAHPSGNLTGSMGSNPELVAGKQLSLLRDISPKISRIAFFGLMGNPVTSSSLAAVTAASAAVGVEVVAINVQEGERLEPYFADARTRGAEAVVIGSYVYFAGPNGGSELRELQAKYRLQLTTDDRYIAANGVTGYVVLAYLALAYRMPSIGNFPPGPAGVLFGYGANTQAIFRRAASVYIAAILNGAKPADMAVELPSSFDLVVNLKTAEALGISVPLSVQLQATEVIS